MRHEFHSLDQVYRCEAELLAPDRYKRLLNPPEGGRLIAQGAGVSYSAASFGPNSTVLGMLAFDRILDFDEAGLRLTVEAGANLGRLYEFLRPRMLTLAVQPGHPQITIGGCIACNVHGKNQFKEGLFDSVVEEMTLFHPDHGVLRLSRTENANIFDLTLGGLGLTGIILTATLRLARLAGNRIAVENRPVASLGETLGLMEQLKGSQDLLYSWNDLSLNPLAPVGRGFLVTGRFESEADAPVESAAFDQIDTLRGRRLRVFCDPLMPVINAAYHFLHTRVAAKGQMTPFSFTFPVANKLFYFDWYGRQGLMELQMLIPGPACADYIPEFEALVRKRRLPVYLTTLKAFQGRQTLLNYTGDGYSLTLDMPANSATRALYAELDELNCRYGAITNICKDSRLDARTARRQYPELESFSRRLREFDPSRRFASEISERIEL